MRPETNRRTFEEVAAGGMPRSAFDYDGPLLAVAGEREPGSVRAAFPLLRAALPQTKTWIAPKMHHPWNIEDPDLFTRMVLDHVDAGLHLGLPPGLFAKQATSSASFVAASGFSGRLSRAAPRVSL